MKMKQILAGVLTAAMVLTGIPSSGLALQAQAAEERIDRKVEIKMGGCR